MGAGLLLGLGVPASGARPAWARTGRPHRRARSAGAGQGRSGAGKSTLLGPSPGCRAADTAEQGGGADRGRRAPAGEPGPDEVVIQDPDGQLVMNRAGETWRRPGERGVPPDGILTPVDGALAAVGFPTGAAGRPQALSGGEKQRLVLAGRSRAGPACSCWTSRPRSSTATARPWCGPPSPARADRAATVVVVDHDAGPGFRSSTASSRSARRPASSTAGMAPAPAPAGRGCRPPRRTGAARGRRAPASPTAGAAPGAAADRRRLTGGRTLAVTGPNGTGKSTLALLLAGLRAPTTGRVKAVAELDRRPPPGGTRRRTDGRPKSWSAGSERCSRTRSSSSSPAGCATNWRWGRCVRGARRGGAGPPPTSCSSGWGSPRSPRPTRTRSPAGSSGGCRVATALATSPRVLVLDEPTFGQDADTWRGAGGAPGGAAGPRLRGRRRHPRRATWWTCSPTTGCAL